MKLLKILSVVLVAGLATGCASNSDIKDLQSQIDGLSSKISTVSSDAAKAQSAAELAASKASAAEASASRAAQYSQDTNNKLDRMFKKSMMK
ncbi:MAG: hypothetical protein KAH20_01755 [Methylococcales bacterium]|nr:hypothetical protein [Methylococcales bacterium]